MITGVTVAVGVAVNAGRGFGSVGVPGPGVGNTWRVGTRLGTAAVSLPQAEMKTAISGKRKPRANQVAVAVLKATIFRAIAQSNAHSQVQSFLPAARRRTSSRKL